MDIKIFIILILMFFLFKKIFKSLVTKHYNLHQKLVGTESIPLIGGLILISILAINISLIGEITILFSFIIFFLGILSDINFVKSPKKRLIFQIIFIVFFLHLSNLDILDLRSNFLNEIFLNDYIKIIFLSFCFLVLINGSNFIDGLNGLNLGYFFLIFFFVLILYLDNQIIIDDSKILLTIYTVTFLFILNFFNYLYLGDSGAYLLGFISGILFLEINYLNQHISPYFIALLLWYPSFENFFSILRKIIKKIDPIKPDNNHLHQLIFNFYKKQNFKYKKYSNQISSLTILFYNFIVFYLSINFFSKTKVMILLIIINIFVYISVYLLLKKLQKS